MLCALNLRFSYREDVAAVTDPAETPAEAVCRYALDSGCELVYGAQSHTAPVIAVCSDGRLIAGCWDDEVLFKVAQHINVRDVYRIYDYERAVFVFLEHEREGALQEAAGSGAELTFCGQFGDYLVYRSSKQLLYPLSDLVDLSPIWEEYQ